MATYLEKLQASVRRSGSVLCVGLDPEPDGSDLLGRLKRLIDETADSAAAYKPNLGFFEAMGTAGMELYEAVLGHIPAGHIVVADAKRGDIGHTAARYAHAHLRAWPADAVTVNPLMGWETLDPYLTDAAKAAYVLCLTSNPGAEDLLLRPFAAAESLAHHIAATVGARRDAGTAGLVVGATRPERLASVLAGAPDAPLLIPGVGAQGGDPAALGHALRGHRGIPLVNVTRAIANAAEGARAAARRYHAALLPLAEPHV